ncbi:bric a brac 1 [Carabus blaptoides fortunei]
MSGSAQQYCLRWNNHRSNLLTVFDELLQNEAFTDVTLACDGGTSVKCHKMVLAACSSYFQTLFTELPCRHPVVVLKDVKYSEIKAILEYMYRGEVNVAQDQLAALLKVAEALKVKGLVEENRNSHPKPPHPVHHEDDLRQNSPPNISTSSTNIHSVPHTSNNGSPPHSTAINGPSSYHTKSHYGNIYGKSQVMERSTRISMPMWAVPGMPLPHHPTTVSPQTHPHAAATAAAAMLSSCYDAASSDMSPLKRKKLSSLMMNRDTPILRTVLGQGQVDSSQPVSLVCHPDSHENLHSNGSAHDNDKPIRNEPSEDAQSPYTDISLMDDEDKSKLVPPSSSPLSFSGEVRSVTTGIATYVPQQKPEWKRYKQYTRNDIMSAIEAVRNGMSALQAARKYGVPSRTLYDKVKKLGITTSRPFKRGSNGSSACFPYGLSGTSSPYGGHTSEGDDPNHAALLEASFLQHALDNRGGGDNSLTPSPAAGSEHHLSETNGSTERDRDDDEDQVEDLSMARKPEQQQSRVIMPPMNQVSTIIKKEDSLKEGLRDEQPLVRREIKVEENE